MKSSKAWGEPFPFGFFDDPDPIPIEKKNQEPEGDEDSIPYCQRPEFKALMEKAKRGKQKEGIQQTVKPSHESENELETKEPVYENEFVWDDEQPEPQESIDSDCEQDEIDWDEELSKTETESSPPIQGETLSDTEIEANMQTIRDAQRRAEYDRKRRFGRSRLSRRI